MRIIAGSFKGRRLIGPPDSRVRPTSDSLRETLFNILGPAVGGCAVLDGFAGTGAVGLEALSRGAAHVTFVEHDRRVITVLEENIRRCGAASACAIVNRDFLRGVDGSFDLIFLDPPYEAQNLDASVASGGARVASGGRLVLEHSRRRPPPETAGALRRTRTVTAGDSALSFYE
jgi:16S rRNA (guanine(966)-N(2))-methyltransferase RsmD